MEILIHTTAPSRGKDDATYRALARAYLDFEPLQRVDLEEEEDDVADLLDSQLQDELLHSTQEERESEASYRPPKEDPESVAISTQSNDIDQLLLGDIFSSQLSFDSVEHNLASPPVRWPVGEHLGEVQVLKQSEELKDSCVAPPSIIEDSQPSPEKPAAGVLSPASALESILLLLQSSTGSSSPVQRSSEVVVQTPEMPYGRGKKVATKRTATKRKIGCISSIPETASPKSSRKSVPVAAQKLYASGKSRAHSPDVLSSFSPNILSQEPKDDFDTAEDDTDGNDENRVSSSDPSRMVDSSPTRRPLKRICTEQRSAKMGPEVQVEESHLDELSSDLISMAQSAYLPNKHNVKDSKSEFSGTTQLTTHDGCQSEKTSSALIPTAAFTSSTDVSRSSSLRPSSQAPRFADKLEIHPPQPLIANNIITPERFITTAFKKLERYAHVYNPSTQKRDLRPMERGYWLFEWKSLDSKQRAVWWDSIGDFVSRGLGGWNIWCVRDEELGTLRVYCWGIIVMHVYLMLFVSTEYKIKGKGARWISGDGQDIIIMPS